MGEEVDSIKVKVQEQLQLITDPLVKSALEKIIVEPTAHLRDWDYSLKGEKFKCWTIAIHEPSNTSIVYSDFGFGPTRPWGLVWTSALQFGMDSGWFDNLKDCFLESFAAGDLQV